MTSANLLWTRFVDAAVERTLLLLGWERQGTRADKTDASGAASKVYSDPPTAVQTAQVRSADDGSPSTTSYGLELPTTPSWERDAPKLRARPLTQPVVRAPEWHNADPFSVGEHTGTV